MCVVNNSMSKKEKSNFMEKSMFLCHCFIQVSDIKPDLKINALCHEKSLRHAVSERNTITFDKVTLVFSNIQLA